MRFLVDASLPRSAASMLRELGHDAVDGRDIGMRSATDHAIAALVTRDFDFADIRNYPPADYGGIVVLDYDVKGNLVGIDIDNASAKVQLNKLVLSKLPGKVETVAA